MILAGFPMGLQTPRQGVYRALKTLKTLKTLKWGDRALKTLKLDRYFTETLKTLKKDLLIQKFVPISYPQNSGNRAGS